MLGRNNTLSYISKIFYREDQIRAKMEKGKSEKGTFPGRKPGSVMPKENKKHVSTMVVEKIGETVTSMLKNDKKKIKPLSPDDDGH
nr:hypothetical protein Itr_chr07CG15610 [Ipomoea trifida]